MTINLYINKFVSDNPERQAEYDRCLDLNRSNRFIGAIHFVLPEDGGTGRPTFNDFFRMISMTSGPNDINIVSNSDIYFDETLEQAKTLSSRCALAILRWDLDENGSPKISIHRGDCQDVWIFRGIPKGINGDFQIGIPGCDNRIAHEIKAAGYTVYNPAKLIRTIHVHSQRTGRTYSGKVSIPRPYLHIEPSESMGWSDSSSVSATKFLWNQGVGDHIICNGMARELVERHGEIAVYANHPVASFVKRMYRDDQRISVIPFNAGKDRVPDDVKKYSTYLGGLSYGCSGTNFSQCFYNAAGVDTGSRWSRFYVERDFTRERKLIDHHGLGDYIFVHQDLQRGMHIDLVKGKAANLRIVYSNQPNLSDDIFDYMSLLENAKEIHTICSSFLCLVDTAPLCRHGRLVFHRYAKHHGSSIEWDHPELRKPWEVVR